MEVKFIMKRPICADVHVSIKDAAKLMSQYKIGMIVITNDGKIEGVFTERDLVNSIAKGIDLTKPAIEAATKNVITINENESIEKAAELMRKYRIRHLVVVNDAGEVVGVLSLRDLIDEDNCLKNLTIISTYEELESKELKITS